MRRISTLLLVVPAAALAAAGCGGGSDSGGDTTSQAAPAAQTATTAPSGAASSGASQDSGKSTEIRIQGFAFAPGSAKVKVGQEVEWENYDSVGHDVVATSGASFKSSTLQKDGKFTFTPTQAGTISYVCTFHPQMKATLTVTS